jgi:hypothetical protein
LGLTKVQGTDPIPDIFKPLAMPPRQRAPFGTVKGPSKSGGAGMKNDGVGIIDSGRKTMKAKGSAKKPALVVAERNVEGPSQSTTFCIEHSFVGNTIAVSGIMEWILGTTAIGFNLRINHSDKREES